MTMHLLHFRMMVLFLGGIVVNAWLLLFDLFTSMLSSLKLQAMERVQERGFFGKEGRNKYLVDLGIFEGNRMFIVLVVKLASLN